MNNVNKGGEFFANQKDTFLYLPRFNHAWVTVENVNDLILDSVVQGPIDLLSIDLDGMDYWVWKAITVIEPQVVVIETANPVPQELAVTVPYNPDIVCKDNDFRGGGHLSLRWQSIEKKKVIAWLRHIVLVLMLFLLKTEFVRSVLARRERWPIVQDRNWLEV